MMTTEEKCLDVQILSEESDLQRETAAKWPQGYSLQKGLSLRNVWEIWIWLFPAESTEPAKSTECNIHFICLQLNISDALKNLGMRKPPAISYLGATFTVVVICKVRTIGWTSVSFQSPCSCFGKAVLESSRPVFKSQLLRTWHWVGHPIL